MGSDDGERLRSLHPADPHARYHPHLYLPRICVGMHFANQQLFIAIATILWAADIRAQVDEAGKPMYPSANDVIDKGIVVWVVVCWPCMQVVMLTLNRTVLRHPSRAGLHRDPQRRRRYCRLRWEHCDAGRKSHQTSYSFTPTRSERASCCQAGLYPTSCILVADVVHSNGECPHRTHLTFKQPPVRVIMVSFPPRPYGPGFLLTTTEGCALYVWLNFQVYVPLLAREA